MAHGTDPIIRICDRSAFPTILDMNLDVGSVRGTDVDRRIMLLHKINGIVIRLEFSEGITPT